jgi:hypothetical protein
MNMPSEKRMSAEAAVAPIRNGSCVLIGSGCAAPQRLIEALAARGGQLFDVEILHLMTFGVAPYALTVRFRPIKPTDESLLRELFYSHSEETILHRYTSTSCAGCRTSKCSGLSRWITAGTWL